MSHCSQFVDVGVIIQWAASLRRKYLTKPVAAEAAGGGAAAKQPGLDGLDCLLFLEREADFYGVDKR